MSTIKVLTLHQPFATLIALGVKGIETRGHHTNVRGRIAIHAAARPANLGERIGDFVTVGSTTTQRLEQRPVLAELPHSFCTHPLPLGAIVATANLIDCAYMCDLDTGEGMPDEGGSPALYLYPDERLIISHHFEVPVRSIDVTDEAPYGNFAPGRFAWILDDVRPLAVPYSFRGGQGWSRSIDESELA